MREFYPPVEPYDSGLLDVGDGNEIYWEVCGNPQGKPAVFLHGGPGGGLLPDNRRFFDPSAYRIVLFDQRNCGRSLPSAGDPKVSLEHNTTPHLVADIERLREHLSIDRWLVFGGSWGTTLGLAYAQAHPDRVTEMVLRGVWLIRPADEAWTLTPGGAAHLFPAEWAAFRDAIPAAEQDDLLAAYGRRITDPDPAVHVPASRAWMGWELSANTLRPVTLPEFEDSMLVAFARITHHYISNGGFLPEAGLLAGVDRIRHVPAVIVNGRYDIKTPPDQAWDLHRAWPEAELHIVEDAGHGGSEPGTRHLLIEATDRFRDRRPSSG
ncbi:prolyl aminopeptidase [Actinomadura rubrisoli]|uniref:Proline iminopeptidase n=1 Tax=Actinomadura rubrisoli TaxID=2530368 RepID=A0A4R5BXL8_9ACTN|nr:prolyl aminopeptidase [Actinomadura rubrisoli]TDD90140.1 prolyl aminopeptidase [Actinomadura rubrisoli]